jgi:hypothetical protein
MSIGLIILFLETYVLIFQPFSTNDFTMTEQRYWSLVIPIYLIVFVMVSITVWIGYTMVTTPEPVRFTYEEAYEVALAEENNEEGR